MSWNPFLGTQSSSLLPSHSSSLNSLSPTVSSSTSSLTNTDQRANQSGVSHLSPSTSSSLLSSSFCTTHSSFDNPLSSSRSIRQFPPSQAFQIARSSSYAPSLLSTEQLPTTTCQGNPSSASSLNFTLNEFGLAHFNTPAANNINSSLFPLQTSAASVSSFATLPTPESHSIALQQPLNLSSRLSSAIHTQPDVLNLFDRERRRIGHDREEKLATSSSTSLIAARQPAPNRPSNSTCSLVYVMLSGGKSPILKRTISQYLTIRDVVRVRMACKDLININRTEVARPVIGELSLSLANLFRMPATFPHFANVDHLLLKDAILEPEVWDKLFTHYPKVGQLSILLGKLNRGYQAQGEAFDSFIRSKQVQDFLSAALYLDEDDPFLPQLAQKKGARFAVGRLNLSSCSELSNEQLEALIERCIRFSNLNLQGCSKLTDIALQKLLSWMNQRFVSGGSKSSDTLRRIESRWDDQDLLFFDFSECSGITQQGLRPLLTAVGPRLKSLRCAGLTQLNSDLFTPLDLSNLKRVDLSRCSGIDRVGLSQLFRKAGELENLALAGWELAQIPFQELPPALRKLNLSHCRPLTEYREIDRIGLSEFFRKAGTLKDLSLAGWDLTGLPLKELPVTLEKLDLSASSALTGELLEELRSRLTHLKVLLLTKAKVDQKSLHSLEERFAGMSVSSSGSKPVGLQHLDVAGSDLGERQIRTLLELFWNPRPSCRCTLTVGKAQVKEQWVREMRSLFSCLTVRFA